MLLPFSQRLLSVLQLTRMALVFTAISNSVCAAMLSARWDEPGTMTNLGPPGKMLVAAVLVSVGLYAFGMSLNDIIDRRRDSRMAPARPLPSGRLDVNSAHFICVLMGLLALFSGIALARYTASGTMTMILLIFTAMLITFYDFAGKYLVAPGLITLGLVRFFHATIAAPQLPLLWHPLLMLNHVTIVSMLAYAWEQKRPTLTTRHRTAVIGGLGLLNVLSIGVVLFRRLRNDRGVEEALWINGGLALPVAAALLFAVIAWQIRIRSTDLRTAGQRVMLWGLLYLIVYDVAFTAGYVGLSQAASLMLLLPIAYVAVQAMRGWSKLLSLSQPPTYQRAR